MPLGRGAYRSTASAIADCFVTFWGPSDRSQGDFPQALASAYTSKLLIIQQLRRPEPWTSHL